MQREPIKVNGETIAAPFIMEAAKETQEWDRFLPPSRDLPPTHEYFVENYTIERNGATLMIKEVGIRPKAEQPAAETDGFNRMSDADLEVQAVERGMNGAEFAKLESKARKIKALREFDKKKEPKKQGAGV